MFSTLYDHSPFYDDISNQYFQNITGYDYCGDVSFISTMRALLANRIPSEDSVYLEHRNRQVSLSYIVNYPPREQLKTIFRDFDPNLCGRIWINRLSISCDINIPNQSTPDDFCFDIIKANFGKVFRGWKRLDKITTFFQKQFGVLCYINPSLKSVCIITTYGNYASGVRGYHYLQCAIPAFLPWYFPPEQKLTEEEVSLIYSLREKTPTQYVEAITAIAQHFDFRAMRIKKYLYDFESLYEKEEINAIARTINSSISKINELNDSIAQQLALKSDLEIKLLGLEQKVSSNNGTSEIMEYFLRSKALVFLSLDNVTSTHTMSFAVKSYLTYFKEDIIKSALKNPASYIYAPGGRSLKDIIPAEDISRLVTAIFLTQKIRVRMCAAYAFDLRGNVSARARFPFGSEFSTYTPNPHVDGFKCLGSYQKIINEALLNHDYITAIEQCIASCKSINTGESPTMAKFMRMLYGVGDDYYNNRALELPDGSIVTPKEAIAWLKEQEGEVNE